MSSQNPTYIKDGEIVSSAPLTARLRGLGDSLFVFVMLYFTTLFSTDAYAAARGSPYRIDNGRAVYRSRPTDTTRRYGGDGTGDRPRRMGGFGRDESRPTRLIAAASCGACAG